MNHQDIELHLLLEAIYRRFHYDFRHYSRLSIETAQKTLRFMQVRATVK